jgi:CheY-like chemotaxis protein
VLIVDDDPQVRDFLAEVAENGGFLAEKTDGADAFLRRFRSAAWDAVVLDLLMPGTNGLELLEMLAREGCRAGIVLTSGLDLHIISQAERLGRALGLRVVGSVPKPAMVHEVERLLRKASEPADDGESGGRKPH